MKIMEMEIKETRHIIAYLDFLGVKKRICSGDTEFINQLKFIYHKAKQNCQKINDCTDNMKLTPIKQQIFSDNIVFAQEINTKNTVYQVFNFILFVSAYLHQALLAGFLVRGGITIGDLYIDNTFVSGKALIKAYQLESQIAIYPRVVIDFDVFGILSTLDDMIMKNFSLPVGDDLIYCIDGFRVIFRPPGKRIVLEKIRKAILETCKYERNFKIVQKHLWVITQFNDFCTAQKQDKYQINVLEDYASVEQFASI